MESQSVGIASPDGALREYGTLVQSAREGIAASRGVRGIISSDVDARTMAAFLVHFSALSIPITEPVEGWIRRAGERCTAIGAGDEPFCQLAIEYEIELLPVELGPPFVQNCVRVLGPDILRCMTFVTSHVEFDVGHTKFNVHFLGNLIAQDRRRLPSLATAGAAALQAFSDHLTECWDLGIAFAEAA